MMINSINFECFKDERFVFNKFNDFSSWYTSTNSSSGKMSLRVMHLNIRSLKKHWDSLQIELKFNLGLKMFDVLILSEIFCNETEVDLYNLDMFGYEKAYKLRPSKEGGGLMVFYDSTKLQHTPVDLETSTYESITMNLEFKGLKDKTTFCLHAVYRPPTSSTGIPLNSTLEEFELSLNKLKHHKNLIFIGDTNIDIMKHRDEYGNKEIYNILHYEAVMSTLGLERGIYDYTREEVRNGKLTQTCIDHIYTRSKADVIYTGVITIKLSDHYPVTMKLQSEEYEEVDYRPRHIYKINEKILQLNLDKVEWSDTNFETNNVNKNFDLLLNKFKLVYEASTFKKVIDVDGNRQPKKRKTWISNELINMIRERDRLFKLWRSDPANIRSRNIYKHFRNKVNNAIRSKKNAYYVEKFEIVKKDTKKIWANLNELLCRKKRKSVDEIIIQAMGKSKSKCDIVNGFADYFLNGVLNLKHKCPYNLSSNQLHTNTDINSYFYIPKAEPKTIEKLINGMKTDKSPGMDKIRANDLKLVSSKIKDVLAKLINNSLQNGIFPENLKTSIIRPIYKSKEKNNYQNYRPIAILPTIEKIIEKYVLGHLNKYLKDNNILNINQYGFQQNKSTEQALQAFADKINESMNTKSHALALFIDLSKAFDTIEHKELLKTLETIGIRARYLNWFESYLKNRKFLVKVENELSDAKTLNLGVPQGSMLGPIMFLIYINDLFGKIKDCTILAYADDITLISSNRCLDTAIEKLNNDFKILAQWAHDKKLIINGQKTAMIHFCPQNMTVDREIIVKLHGCDCLHRNTANRSPHINCSCDNIELVDKFKYLGLTIDKKMIFNEHVYDLHKKLSPYVASLYSLKDKINDKIKIVTYQSLIESNIRYGIGIWGVTANTHMNIIKNLQNRCLKILFGDKRIEQVNTWDTINNELIGNLLTPKKIYIYKKIIESFNNDEHKIKKIKICNTRSTVKYVEPRLHSKYGERLPEYYTPHYYNLLPDEIENIRGWKRFKKAVQKWLIYQDLG